MYLFLYFLIAFNLFVYFCCWPPNADYSAAYWRFLILSLVWPVTIMTIVISYWFKEDRYL